MRWPFHFGKRVQGNDAEAASLPAAPLRHDWASLPPIQRAIRSTQFTAPTYEFIDSLAGEHDLDLSAGSLGHEVSLEASRGLVTGFTRPIETYASSAELVRRRRPHSASTVQRRAFASVETEAGFEPAQSEPAFEEVEISPPLVLEVIDAPVPTQPPLTRLADAQRAGLMPVVTRARPTPARAESASQLPAREGVEPPPQAPAPPVQRRTLSQSRRAGLGPPLQPAAAAAVQQRSAPPSPRLDLPLAPRPETESFQQVSSETTAAARGVEPTAPEGETHLEQALPSPPGLKAGARTGTRRSGPATPGQPAAPDAVATPVVQTAIALPLPPLLPIPPSPITRTVPLITARHPRSAGLRPPASAPEVDEARSEVIPALDLMPEPAPPAQPAPSWRPETSTRPRAINEIVSRLPLAGAPAVQRTVVESPRPAVAAATPDMPLVPSRMAGEAVVQRAAAPAANESPAASTEAVPVGAASPGISPQGPASTGGLVAEGPAPATSAAAAPSQDGERELYELASKLFDPLMSLFKREVLVDRERAGMLTDLR